MIDANSFSIPLNCKPEGVCVILRISHESLLPDQITQLLNLEPTKSYRMGEKVHPDVRPKTKGAWILDSHQLEAETDVNEHIQWVLARFKDKMDVLNNLRKNEYKIFQDCRFETAHWNTAVRLDLETISLLEFLRMSITFDIYDYGDDEDEENEEVQNRISK